MLVDGDCFYTTDIVGMYREVSATHNATFTFHDTQQKPIYSYVTVDGSADDVVDIREKVKISDHANTGCYCFRNGAELERYCVSIIDAGVMQLSQVRKSCEWAVFVSSRIFTTKPSLTGVLVLTPPTTISLQISLIKGSEGRVLHQWGDKGNAQRRRAVSHAETRTGRFPRAGHPGAGAGLLS
jgi:hypothetical protein